MRDRNLAPANQTSSIEGGSLMPAPRILLVVLLGLLSLSVTCWAAAPQVVATVPELGAGAVDPQSSEIRVTFDQPMDPSSYSWVTLGSRSLPPGLPDGRAGRGRQPAESCAAGPK